MDPCNSKVFIKLQPIWLTQYNVIQNLSVTNWQPMQNSVSFCQSLTNDNEPFYVKNIAVRTANLCE